MEPYNYISEELDFADILDLHADYAKDVNNVVYCDQFTGDKFSLLEFDQPVEYNEITGEVEFTRAHYTSGILFIDITSGDVNPRDLINKLSLHIIGEDFHHQTHLLNFEVVSIEDGDPFQKKIYFIAVNDPNRDYMARSFSK